MTRRPNTNTESAVAVQANTGFQIQPSVMSVADFCQAHGISKPTYYNMKKAGQGPREMIVGRRRLISHEAAADWRRERESA